MGHLLRRAHQRATAVFLEWLGKAKITPTQFAVLAKLADEGELSQNHLGRLTAMDPATIQGVTRCLGARGLIAGRADPEDGRRTLLSLSAKGKCLVKRLIPRGYSRAAFGGRAQAISRPAQASRLRRPA